MNMRDELKAFVDNELSEERRTEILRRLETDRELQAEVIELRQMSRTIREEAWQPEPVGLERTLAALENPRKKAPWWYGGQVGWALGTASLAALAIIFFPKFSGGAEADSSAAGSTYALQVKSPVAPKFGSVTTASPADASENKGGMAAPLSALPEGRKESQTTNTPSAPKAQVRYQQNTYLDQRYLAQSAHLDLEVESVSQAETRAKEIAKVTKGKVLPEKTKKKSDAASAEMTLKVPAEHFAFALDELRSLGTATTPNISQDYPNIRPESSAPVAGRVDPSQGKTRLKVEKPEEDYARMSEMTQDAKTPLPEATLNLRFVEKQPVRERAALGASAGGRARVRDKGTFKPVAPKPLADTEVLSREPRESESQPFDWKYALLALPALFLVWLGIRALRRK